MAVYDVNYLNEFLDININKIKIPDIDISAAQINSWINSSFFNEANDSTTDIIDKVQYNLISKLKQLGINIKSIQSCAQDILQVLKTNGLNKNSKQKIYTIVSDFLKKMALELSIGIDADGNTYDKNKIKSSITLLLWVLAINTLSQIIFNKLFGRIAGNIVLCCIVAPISEEASKEISVKGHFDKEYFYVFNICEMGTYVIDMVRSGEKLLKSIGLRLFGVYFHYNLTKLHKIFNSEETIALFDGETDKEKEDKATTCGMIYTILLHALNNILAMIRGAHMIN